MFGGGGGSRRLCWNRSEALVSAEWTAGEAVCVVAPDVQTKVRVRSRRSLHSVLNPVNR